VGRRLAVPPLIPARATAISVVPAVLVSEPVRGSLPMAQLPARPRHQAPLARPRQRLAFLGDRRLDEAAHHRANIRLDQIELVVVRLRVGDIAAGFVVSLVMA
jgi:hypothetical protein